MLNELNQLLKKSVTKVGAENDIKLDQRILEQIEFEISTEQLRGDYASSCCLKLAKHFKKKPAEIAESIVANLNDKK